MKFLNAVESVNSFVNGLAWGWPALVLLAFVGVFMTCRTKFFQVSHIGHWMKQTAGAIFKDREGLGHTTDKSISNLVSTVFSMHFGFAGAAFVAISVMLFAFSTCLGWSHYGSKACEFLFGEKITKVYQVIFGHLRRRGNG